MFRRSILFVSIVMAAPALGQSSSLFVQDQVPQRQAPPVAYARQNQVENNLSPAIAASSFGAVRIPEPRLFTVNDLVTIVVRESSTNDTKADMETGKETKIKGELSEFPTFSVADFVKLGADQFVNGTPKVELDFKKDFTGDGKFKRSDAMTTRLTAKIIDIKPNGLLVLEARRYMRTDEESVAITLTGMCRSADVAGDNSVLSTNMHDLRLIKEHDGEIKGASQKGIFTKAFEFLFAF
ncbi:MAG: flagellar basal body L-ring protein FlgH [Phycisphaeraceae bacterium]